MNDRIPGSPGRYQMTRADGTAEYVTLTLADEPLQAGTALNKANLLSDETAALLEALTGTLPETPNQALALLAGSGLHIATGTYTGYGSYGTSGKNTLTFDFSPALVVVHGAEASAGSYPAHVCFTKEGTQAGSFSSNNNYQVFYEISGNTLTWWVTSGGSAAQMNGNGYKYNYVAIG